jgi:hypothetical protein
MNRHRLAVILCLLVSSQCMVTPSHAQLVPSGSLDVVDRYQIPLTMSSEEKGRIETAVRDFIWHRWHEHIPGRVDVTRFGTDAETTFSFTIGRDPQGRWRVFIHAKRRHFLMHERKPETIQSNNDYVAVLVRRVEISSDSTLVLVPDSEGRAPDTYRLELLDANGQILLRQ